MPPAITHHFGGQFNRWNNNKITNASILFKRQLCTRTDIGDEQRHTFMALHILLLLNYIESVYYASELSAGRNILISFPDRGSEKYSRAQRARISHIKSHMFDFLFSFLSIPQKLNSMADDSSVLLSNDLFVRFELTWCRRPMVIASAANATCPNQSNRIQ